MVESFLAQKLDRIMDSYENLERKCEELRKIDNALNILKQQDVTIPKCFIKDRKEVEKSAEDTVLALDHYKGNYMIEKDGNLIDRDMLESEKQSVLANTRNKICFYKDKIAEYDNHGKQPPRCLIAKYESYLNYWLTLEDSEYHNFLNTLKG